MTDVKNLFGSKVRTTRLEMKISQEDLAFKSGLHRTYISEVELGRRNISLENIRKISKALGLRISDMFNGLQSTMNKDWKDKVKDFCEKYNIPVFYLSETLYEPKV